MRPLEHPRPIVWWRGHYGSSAARVGYGWYTLSDLGMRARVRARWPREPYYNQWRPAGLS